MQFYLNLFNSCNVDVKTTSILVFVANHLITFTVSHIVIVMLVDIFHIRPPAFLQRRFRFPEKPISTITLPHQAVALVFSTVSLILSAAFHVAFVFTHSGTFVVRQGGVEIPPSTIQPTLDRLGIAMPYREVQFSQSFVGRVGDMGRLINK